MTPLITIFSAPKPFTNQHIARIQRNAIRSWAMLAPEAEVVLLGEEDGLAQAAAELGVKHIPQVQRNASGTPLISAMFELARQVNDSPLLLCVNADIILLPDCLKVARQTAAQAQQFLLVGQRWDMDVRDDLDFSEGWETRLRNRLCADGKLHPPSGSDYFIFPRQCFRRIPDFAIGRAGWDNWMIYDARRQGWPTVDATGSIDIIHQAHDYSHLPDGQPHYRLPETFENTRLAGGKRHIFHLIDCDRVMHDGSLKRYPLSWGKLAREIETFPLLRLHSAGLGQVFFAFFHPLRAYRELRVWLRHGQTGS